MITEKLKNKKKNKNKSKLSPVEKIIEKLKRIEAREKRRFLSDIENIFIFSGFKSIKSENKPFHFYNRDHEIDHIFIYENIIVLCERTAKKIDISSHLLQKQDTYSRILKDKTGFLNIAKEVFPDFGAMNYEPDRYHIFYLYFSLYKNDWSEEEKNRYQPIRIIENSIFLYMKNLSSCIKKSFRFELFKFLKLEKKDIGIRKTGTTASEICASIIYSKESTGLKNGVRIVSFMMSPEDLIENAYILRKDSWEDQMDLYQRMVTRKRLQDIRKYIIKNEKSFVNNIIVTLPNTVIFKDNEGDVVPLEQIYDHQSCRMFIEGGYNKIGIIDGQHRVLSHYENNLIDDEEEKMKKLRKELNLLVTGIIFPASWERHQRIAFESDIFIDINETPKKVKSDIIMNVERAKNPFVGKTIAYQVLQKMNKVGPFKGLLEISSVQKAPIKIISIIKYALSSLVTADINCNGLYKYWTPKAHAEKKDILDNYEHLNQYIDYCVKSLNIYFSAIEDVFQKYWRDKKSMLLKVVSINGFIMCLNNTLYKTNGMRDFQFYKNIFEKSDLNFSKEKFKFAGSRYSEFSEEVLEKLFVNAK